LCELAFRTLTKTRVSASALDLLNRDRQAVLRLRLAHLGRRRSWRRSSQCINHLRGVRYHRYCAHVAAERVLAGELVLD